MLKVCGVSEKEYDSEFSLVPFSTVGFCAKVFIRKVARGHEKDFCCTQSEFDLGTDG